MAVVPVVAFAVTAVPPALPLSAAIAGAGGALPLALVFWGVIHASNSLGATVNTLNRMFACDVPQYSAQKPFQAYAESGVNQM